MNRNLEFYVKVYDNWLQKDLCEKTVEEMRNISWEKHEFYDSLTGQSGALSDDKEFDVSWSDNVSTKELIMQRIWDAYRRYTNELEFSWFDSWQGFTNVRFNRYAESTRMALHCDHIHSAFDGYRKGIPTMTCLSLLNEDFEGGELIMFDDYQVEMRAGTTIVFPSVFLYPHKVLPISKGVRYSCVSWAW